ncbi:bifunctional metallophosphatase/5'-nucleotidase [Alteromonas lipolytica]|uniref:bifunctional metallophosphatase/5'-nucleotidase n=1 Tax=Alteromonas lipolytica TaxID=1856405 RepID=UPI0011130C74|nr:5'-nucleotidase C-terminal domain-containing protein [Alteromonas lipolytica]GGF68710.1 multifunctional 2',3'-cyclic-nucleotide 2'-phosphodiesterase/5'-nucleotidase/3'-nucleotidase [Alteromonas lipolytica]
MQSKQLTLLYTAELPLIKNPPYGSYANLATLVSEIRAEQQPSLFLFGGGSLAPSMLSSFDRGAHVIDILNSIEPDAMGVAKREFSYFEDELSLRAYEAAFPLILSNAIDPLTGHGLDGTEQQLLLSKGNTRVGILTVIDNAASEEYLLQRLRIEPPYEDIINQARALREQGAELVILMISDELTFVNKLLKDGVVDLVLRNDPHYERPIASDEQPVSNYVIVTEDATAARITIQWPQNQPQQAAFNITMVPLSDYPEDDDIAAQVTAYDTRIKALLSEQVTLLTTPMDTTRSAVRTGENGFGNLVSDALREASHTDVALFNGGGIRGDRTYEKGHILTREDISSEIPFRNHIRVMKITGADLKAALENGVSRVEDASGRFPHISGMTCEVLLSAPPGQRIEKLLINGQPVQPGRYYTLATTDYLASGGDGYESLKRGIEVPFSQQVTPLIADIVISVLRRHTSLAASTSGRLMFISGKGN